MTFTANIPTITQSLAISRPMILDNFSNYKANMEVNHKGVNDANKGKHTLIQIPSVQTDSPGTAVGEMAFYTKAVGGVPQLFVQPENLPAAGSHIQITNLLQGAGELAKLGTVTDVISGAYTISGGWTYLPGGLIMQYGLIRKTNGLGISSGNIDWSVSLPISFPTAWITATATINFNLSSTPSGKGTVFAAYNQNDLTKFKTTTVIDTGQATGFNFICIGY